MVSGKTLMHAPFFCCLSIVVHPGSVTYHVDACRKIMTSQTWFPSTGNRELELLPNRTIYEASTDNDFYYVMQLHIFLRMFMYTVSF